MSQSLLRIAALLPCLLLIGCGGGDRQAGDTVERPGEPPVTYVEDDDAKMNAAMDQARATVEQFIAALGQPATTQDSFAVKVPVVDGENVEHMWVNPVRHQAGRFIGTINNEPNTVTTVKLGDEVNVPQAEISDWMFVDGGKLVGGYTLRVLRETLPPDERAQFDASVPFTID